MARCVAAAIAILIATQPVSASSLEWILLVDTSKSIGGKVPGSQDIFDDVQTSLREFIKTSNVGDTFYIHTFDTRSRFRSIIPIVDEANRTTLSNIFDDPIFRPNGDCTHIGDAVLAGLNQAAFFQDAGRTPVVVLFTDGIETCPASATTRLAELKISKVEMIPHAFYVVWLGDPLQEATVREQFPSRLRGSVSVLVRPHAQEIASLSQELRNVLPPSLVTEASVVDLGVVRPGHTAESSGLTVTASRNAAVRLNLSGEGLAEFQLTGLPEPTRLKAGKNKIAVSIAAPASVPAGTHKGVIEIRLAEDTTVRDDDDHPLLALTASVVVSRSWLPAKWLLPLSVLLTLSSVTLLYLGIAGRRSRKLSKPVPIPGNDRAETKPSQRREPVTPSRDEIRAMEARVVLDRTLAELRKINDAIEELLTQARTNDQRLAELTARRDQLAAHLRQMEASLTEPPTDDKRR